MKHVILTVNNVANTSLCPSLIFWTVTKHRKIEKIKRERERERERVEPFADEPHIIVYNFLI